MIKKIKFLLSLPKLTIPGITKDDIYKFLKDYRPKTPAAVLKLVSNQFMRVLPDANMLSKLEVMILANIAKRDFVSYNDLEFCSSISNIVEKYDRSVLSYRDLLSTIRRVAKKNIKLFPASEEIKDSLVQLNQSSKKLSVYSNKKIYDCLLRKADKFRKNEKDFEAYVALEEAILMNPGRSEAYFKVSDVYNDNDRFQDAVGVLDDLIVAEPCKPVMSAAFLKRANLFLSHGNYNAALQDLEGVDDSDYRKYRVRDRCVLESGRIKSVTEELAVLAKEFFNCYVKPGLFYWNNSRKKIFSNKLVFCIKMGIRDLVESRGF
jgi:tetratricopeptide (TPR) repeat protein